MPGRGSRPVQVALRNAGAAAGGGPGAGRGGGEGPGAPSPPRGPRGSGAGAEAGPEERGGSRGLAARRRPRPGDSPESGGAGGLDGGAAASLPLGAPVPIAVRGAQVREREAGVRRRKGRAERKERAAAGWGSVVRARRGGLPSQGGAREGLAPPRRVATAGSR